MMWRLLFYKIYSWVVIWFKVKVYFKIYCFRRRMFIKILYLLKIYDVLLVIFCVVVLIIVFLVRFFELIFENLVRFMVL